MKGDPTEFGFKECQMSNVGYDIVRASIAKSENHSYGPSCGTIVFIEIYSSKPDKPY